MHRPGHACQYNYICLVSSKYNGSGKVHNHITSMSRSGLQQSTATYGAPLELIKTSFCCRIILLGYWKPPIHSSNFQGEWAICCAELQLARPVLHFNWSPVASKHAASSGNFTLYFIAAVPHIMILVKGSYSLEGPHKSCFLELFLVPTYPSTPDNLEPEK